MLCVPFPPCLPSSRRELQALIDQTKTTDSPYHISHAATSTDITVYPANPAPATPEPEAKRRKRSAGDVSNGDIHLNSSSGLGALYPQRVAGNKHIRKVQEQNKEYFEELIDLCVSPYPSL